MSCAGLSSFFGVAFEDCHFQFFGVYCLLYKILDFVSELWAFGSSGHPARLRSSPFFLFFSKVRLKAVHGHRSSVVEVPSSQQESARGSPTGNTMAVLFAGVFMIRALIFWVSTLTPLTIDFKSSFGVQLLERN